VTRYEIRARSLGEILDAGLWLLRDHGRVLVGTAAVLHERRRRLACRP